MSDYDDLTPDHEFGFTVDFLADNLTDDDYADLMAWMRGQTGAITDDGRFVVYGSDFRNWCRGGPILD